jgi:hypothetical protein
MPHTGLYKKQGCTCIQKIKKIIPKVCLGYTSVSGIFSILGYPELSKYIIYCVSTGPPLIVVG